MVKFIQFNMKLSTTKIKGFKAQEKPYKKPDGNGLIMIINPNGSKWWRFNYRIYGKQKTLSMGTFPDVSLAQARDRVHEARKLVANGIDPSIKRKKEKSKGHLFINVAKDWFGVKSNKWKASHAQDVWNSLEQNVFEYLGHRPIDKITVQDVHEVLKKIENRNSLEVLRKVRQRCNGIFIFAKVKGLIPYNPAEGIEEVLKTPVSKNYNTIKPEELPELAESIEQMEGFITTKAGLKIALYTFLRTSEIRFTRWEEIDFNHRIWTIPSERMKMKRDHIVPMANQVVEIFKALIPITGESSYVFASAVDSENKPFSENAMLYALYRMGYRGRMTVHGFRHLASTTLNELGFDSRFIEKQLSHEDRNAIRGAYNKAEYLEQRIEMMQFWADYVDQRDKKIVPIRSSLVNERKVT